LADKLFLGKAELPQRRGIGKLDQSCCVQRQDGVGRTLDNGVVARVLSVAEDALTLGRRGHVEYLDSAERGFALTEGAHGDVVQQLPAGAGAQREYAGMKRVADQAGGA